MDWGDGMCIFYIVKAQMQRILELGRDTKTLEGMRNE